MRVGLDGRVVLVTGAAGGVGRAVAERCAEAGAAGLLLTDRDAEGLAGTAAALGVPCETVAADLARDAAAGEVAAACVARFGRIDGLVNAAALTDRGGVEATDRALWDRLFDVNARAPFLLMGRAIADMRGRGAPGAVVNILSVNAHCGAPDLAVYSATKGALLTLTRNAAHAHLADRIRVNGIALGWTVTPAEERMQASLGQGADWAEAAGRTRPLGRLLEPDEAARQALWLLAEASAPLTGVVIDLEQRVFGAPA